MKKKIEGFVLSKVVPKFAASFINILYGSMRIEVIDDHKLFRKEKPVILAFWHDQLLLMVKGYRGAGAKILISESKDGELIAKTMAHFGQESVRGSSSRGGFKAFKVLLKLAREPYDLVITPDGPRGPRHIVKEGVVQLALITKRPVIPLCFVCSRGHRFSSWDRFLLPYPFGRGVFRYGEPIIPCDDDSTDDLRVKLQKGMEENEKKARDHLEKYGVLSV